MSHHRVGTQCELAEAVFLSDSFSKYFWHVHSVLNKAQSCTWCSRPFKTRHLCHHSCCPRTPSLLSYSFLRLSLKIILLWSFSGFSWSGIVSSSSVFPQSWLGCAYFRLLCFLTFCLFIFPAQMAGSCGQRIGSIHFSIPGDSSIIPGTMPQMGLN